MHLPAKPAFDEKLRELLNQSMEETQVAYHKSGTMVTIEGSVPLHHIHKILTLN